jgi:hypothetical protein
MIQPSGDQRLAGVHPCSSDCLRHRLQIVSKSANPMRPDEALEPPRGNPRLAIVCAGDLPTDGRRCIGVIAQIGGSKYGGFK